MFLQVGPVGPSASRSARSAPARANSGFTPPSVEASSQPCGSVSLPHNPAAAAAVPMPRACCAARIWLTAGGARCLAWEWPTTTPAPNRGQTALAYPREVESDWPTGPSELACICCFQHRAMRSLQALGPAHRTCSPVASRAHTGGCNGMCGNCVPIPGRVSGKDRTGRLSRSRWPPMRAGRRGGP